LAEELVTIYSFYGSSEAYLWKEKLKASGIKSVVIHDFNTGASAPSNELQVRKKDVSKAQKILEPLKKTHSIKIIGASVWLIFIFGIIIVIPGFIFLIFSPEKLIALVFLVYGGSFIFISFFAMTRKKIKHD